MRLVLFFLLSAVAASSVSCSRDQPGAPKVSPPKEEAVVIFRAADGRTLTMADLQGLSGPLQYEILYKSDVLPAEAESLHKQARQAGGAGDYKKAIALLERASSLAPAWPYPVYDMAFTYLLMKDAEKARKHYRKTVELAPRGFFTAITALDALEREANGDLPAGTYLAYVSLEWMDDAVKKADAVRQLIKRVPDFAPTWKAQAMQADTDAEKLAAIEKGLAANPDGETKGILLINKALIMERSGDHEGAVRLLGELALNPASTYATEHLAKVTLANITMK
jgi:tetratricopeptide (TPR) repeat protein